MRRIMAAAAAAGLAAALGVADPAGAQQIAFGELGQNTDAPVEVTADRLEVDQPSGSAVFSGDVTVGQGDMTLEADQVRVEYEEGGEGIRRLLATGGVTLVNGAEAAEAQEAEYTIASGVVVMTGDVLLTQRGSALSSERLTVNLKTGTGTMEGRVRSILQPGGN